MTTTYATPAPLLRRPNDRAWLGVCAALGRATHTDPVLWRVCVGVLTVFGGTGLLLYGAGWLLIPEQGADGSVLPARLRLPHRARPTLTVVVLGALLVAALLNVDSDGVAPLTAVALLVFLVLRRPEALGERPQQPLAPAEPSLWTGAPASAAAPASWAADPWQAAYLPSSAAGQWSSFAAVVPVRPVRRPVFLLVTSVALLAVGALLALGATGLLAPTAGRVLAVALVVLAAGQLLMRRWGRSRPLVGLQVLLVAALALIIGLGVDARLSAGQRTWQVSGSAERSLGAGDAVLDLRSPGGTDRTSEVKADVGLGNLRIELPPGRHVVLVLRVGAGQVVLPGEAEPVSGTHLVERREYGPPGEPVVRLQARVGAGQLEVLRAAS